ncbi:MAG: imidazole glycerol phosphate synthase subunit HisH [Propionibacteriaceae bacterium]|jgi:glutamine amidotransferase|nr:imidazole glycerol phosphate synthase subunit HisH [Propionibacteriaceae bacterium]
MSRVVVLDYGSGNLHSVASALEAVGAVVQVSADIDLAAQADGLVVPGVGTFAACMASLTAIGGDQVIRTRVAQSRPILGICVGHQILFSAGVEQGSASAGVGLFPGAVQPLPTRRLPHMGWNTVEPSPKSRFFTTGEPYYFVHSYAAQERADLPPEAIALWATHEGHAFIAAVEAFPILSTQFHPEKSGPIGLALLKRWLRSLPEHGDGSDVPACHRRDS